MSGTDTRLRDLLLNGEGWGGEKGEGVGKVTFVAIFRGSLFFTCLKREREGGGLILHGSK